MSVSIWFRFIFIGFGLVFEFGLFAPTHSIYILQINVVMGGKNVVMGFGLVTKRCLQCSYGNYETRPKVSMSFRDYIRRTGKY